jgi:hypothetical protein
MNRLNEFFWMIPAIGVIQKWGPYQDAKHTRVTFRGSPVRRSLQLNILQIVIHAVPTKCVTVC